MKWRFLGPKDFEWMVAISKEHHKESDWSEVTYSEDKVRNYIQTAIKDPNYFAIIVKEDDKRIGFMAGRILDLYVEPKHRNGMAGIFMMKKFIEWATVKKAREVLFEPRLSDGAIKKFDAMAKRLGMEHLANAYRRKLT